MEDCVFTILVVEDDKDLQEIYKEHLARKDRIIMQAFSAEEALTILNETTPDAIVLDVGLPKISGIEFLKRIFKKKEVPDIPVFIVSGCDDLETRLSGYISGAARYFIKPVEMSDLTRCIEDAERRNPHCGNAAFN